MVILTNIALLATENSRSFIYLKQLIQENLIPHHIYFLPSPQKNQAGILTLAKLHNISYTLLPSEDINHSTIREVITKASEDTFIYSCGGGRILSAELLTCGKRFLHAHAGKLPQYRGSTTAYYAILLDDNITASAIWLKGGIDTGDVVSEVTIPLEALQKLESEDIDHLIEPYIRALAIIKAIKAILNAQEAFQQNNQEAETYYRIHPILKHIAILKFLNYKGRDNEKNLSE